MPKALAVGRTVGRGETEEGRKEAVVIIEQMLQKYL